MTPVEAMKQDLMDLLYRTCVRPVVLSTISQEKLVSIFQKQSITKNPGVHRSTPYSKSGRQMIGGGGIPMILVRSPSTSGNGTSK